MMYSRILVPVDDSEASVRSLEAAIKMARTDGSQMQLVHVLDKAILDAAYGTSTYQHTLLESMRKAGWAILELAQTIAQRQGIHAECVLLEVDAGSVADSIVAQANSWPADLIVMGSIAKDVRQVIGAVAIPVLMVNGADALSANDGKTSVAAVHAA